MAFVVEVSAVLGGSSVYWVQHAPLFRHVSVVLHAFGGSILT